MTDGERAVQMVRLQGILDFLVEQTMDQDEMRAFIAGLDERQADVDFTVDLVTDLAISVSEEVAADEGEKKPMLQFWAFGKPNYVHPDQVVAALATEPPARIIEIMGRALAEARKMAAGADELLDSPCTHEGDCGCPDGQVELDWTTPKGILRLEKTVKKQARSDCDGCGHALSAHNGGEAYNVCLPGFPNEGCMACTMNEKEK